jgi:hypothetical protein
MELSGKSSPVRPDAVLDPLAITWRTASTPPEERVQISDRLAHRCIEPLRVVPVR